MSKTQREFQPDYATPPSWLLEEYLESWGMSQAELARRCGRSRKLISEIVNGKAPIEPETALQFEKVLGLKAYIWLSMESSYRLHLARGKELREFKDAASWAERFPLRELVDRNCMEEGATDAENVSNLLTFFGVASVDAWDTKYADACMNYRHSPSFASQPEELYTWHRLGEISAIQSECDPYSKTQFRKALGEIRSLTASHDEDVLEKIQDLCMEAGVALIFTEPLPQTRLSGAAWWYSDRKAVIQLSARHKTDDHLWFSLFHEAAHILKHPKKAIHIEIKGEHAKDQHEREADTWATDHLIPRRRWDTFVAGGCFDKPDIKAFALEQGIAPGIVVGRLQHEKLIPWRQHNDLKRRLGWTDHTLRFVENGVQ